MKKISVIALQIRVSGVNVLTYFCTKYRKLTYNNYFITSCILVFGFSTLSVQSSFKDSLICQFASKSVYVHGNQQNPTASVFFFFLFSEPQYYSLPQLGFIRRDNYRAFSDEQVKILSGNKHGNEQSQRNYLF